MCIEKVTFLDNYIIEIDLTYNYKFYFDLRPMIHSKRFQGLVKDGVFNKGKLEDSCRIVWDESTKLEDYEIFGFEIYESNLYVPSYNKYDMECAIA